MVRSPAATWARGPRSKRSWSSISFRFVATVTILDPLGAPDVNPDEAAAQPCQVPGTLVPGALLGPACRGPAELSCAAGQIRAYCNHICETGPQAAPSEPASGPRRAPRSSALDTHR